MVHLVYYVIVATQFMWLHNFQEHFCTWLQISLSNYPQFITQVNMAVFFSG